MERSEAGELWGLPNNGHCTKRDYDSTDRRVIGLYHWKLTCILVSLFSSSVRLSLVNMQKLYLISFLLLSFSFLHLERRMIQWQLSPELLTSHMHTLHLVSPSKKKKNRTLRDWWAASPVSWELLCVPLVLQEDLVEEPPQGWNEEEELSTLKVWSHLFIWDKTVASLLSFLFSRIQL